MDVTTGWVIGVCDDAVPGPVTLGEDLVFVAVEMLWIVRWGVDGCVEIGWGLTIGCVTRKKCPNKIRAVVVDIDFELLSHQVADWSRVESKYGLLQGEIMVFASVNIFPGDCGASCIKNRAQHDKRSDKARFPKA